MGRFWKAIGAAVGGVVAMAITTFAPQTGLELNPEMQGLIMTILPVVSTYFFPKNAD